MNYLLVFYFSLFLLPTFSYGQARIDPGFALKYYNQIYSGANKDQRNNPIASISPETIFGSKFSKQDQRSTCDYHIEILINATVSKELWAIKTIDAWGKPLPSGLLKGNLLWLGNYDECVDGFYQQNNRSYVKQPIQTQYCAIHSIPTEPVDVRTGLILGICLPASCSRLEIVELLNDAFNLTSFTKNNLHCSNDRHNEANEYWTGTIVFIIILSILAILVLIGTFIDLICFILVNQTQTKKPTKEESLDLSVTNETFVSVSKPKISMFKQNNIIAFIAELSALRTIKRIIEINTRKNENTFGCLDGIRVLSLCWVILGHSFSSGIYYTSNMLDMQNAQRNFIIQWISAAAFAVDTFFVLSGFLTTVLFIRQMKKEPVSMKTMALYYIHRYIRLTPSFILFMFVSIYLTPYFGRGPLYPIQQGFEPNKCRDGNWWSAFLYVGNFLKSADICNGITWYLYNDMQFYWIAPLALIPFVKGKKLFSYIIAIILVFVSIGSTLGILLYYPRLAKDDSDVASNETLPIMFDIIYMKPYCRVSPYAIGMIVGFIISQTGRNYRIKRMPLIIGNTIAVILGLACIFGNYGDQLHESGISRASNTAYLVISRPVWGLAIGWLVFICSIHQGGIIDRFLSSPLWAPLVRINYATYLVHMTVILITLFNLSNPSYYQFITCLNSYVSQLIFSYLAAIPIVIFFETPFFFLEKKIFKR